MLQVVKMVLLGVMALSCLGLLVRFLKGKSLKKVFVWSCLSGVVSLFILGMFGENVLPALPINPYTLGVSSFLGIPGVILLTLTKIIWQL